MQSDCFISQLLHIAYMLSTDVSKVCDKTCDVTDQIVYMPMTIVCSLCSYYTCFKYFGNSLDVLNCSLSHFQLPLSKLHLIFSIEKNSNIKADSFG